MFFGAKLFAVGVFATLFAARDLPFEADFERGALDFFVDDLAKTLRSFRETRELSPSPQAESSNEPSDTETIK